MASLSYQISSLLEKMSSPDKDFRFMATNDLMTELQKDNITLDDDTERKVVRTVLRLLEDKNGEVQNLAVRCLAPLTHKIDAKHLEIVGETLCNNMCSTNEQLRDVSSIALKTVVAEIPVSSVPQAMFCVKRVMPKLIQTLSNDFWRPRDADGKTDISVKLESLDIISNLIIRFGRIFALGYTEIENMIFNQLKKERQALRKRCIVALSHMMEVVGHDQYDRIVCRVLLALETYAESPSNLRCYIAAASGICRSSPGRFAPYLEKIVPQFVNYCEKFDDDELKEACLHAFEVFCSRCALEIAPHLDTIVGIVSKVLVYDPNYHYDDSDDAENMDLPTNEMETDSGESDEEEDDDEDEYSDDDDLSWKVRRAAAKCLESVINYQPNKLLWNFVNLGPMLIKRFKEREVNVKYDIFQAYAALLKQTTRFYPDNGIPNQSDIKHMISDSGISLGTFEKFMREEAGPHFQEILKALESQTPLLVKAVYAQMKVKNLKTRHQCFTLLCHLLMAMPNALEKYFQYFILPAQQTLNDRLADGITKINALHFILITLNTHHAKTLHPYVDVLTPLVVNAVKDPFYKIASEAIAVAQLFILMLRPKNESVGDFNYSPYVGQLYDAIIAKLKISDIDQEVKEKVIVAAGLLIAVFPDEPSVKLSEGLALLLDRLRNEMTRVVTVKAFHAIVTSVHKVNLSEVLPELLQLCSEFLRKNHRTLRILTLVLLDALVVRYYHGGLENANLIRVVKEVPPLISEHDLQISLLSVNFVINVVNAYPDQISDALGAILTSLIRLTESSLLHGNALTASLKLYEAIVKSPLPNKPRFEHIINDLSVTAYDNQGQGSNKQALVCMAKSIAVVTKTFNSDKDTGTLLLKLSDSLTGTSTLPDHMRILSTLTIGEIGRIYYDAFSVVDQMTGPEELVMQCFNINSEDLNSAASYALGCLAVGNMEKNLPFLLDEINKNPKRQYQLLHALKEVITSESTEEIADSKSSALATFKANLPTIWSVLVSHCDCTEEGIRNVVAECLGKICLMDAQQFLPCLLELVGNESSRVRRTVVNAARFMIVDYRLPVIDEMLRSCLGKFLDTIRDEDLQVRRAAIVTLNSAAHNKPKLLSECLNSLLPHLYAETAVKPELVYEVEMGPFKHIVDDGLDLRKAAFECMYTLSERFIGKIDIFEYMTHMEAGLSDQHDIKLLTFLMLSRLSRRCPLQLLQRLDRLCERIKPSLMIRPKANAVKQENEKQDELKRAAVRTCHTLRRIQNLETSQKLNELFEIITGCPELRSMEEALEQDKSHLCPEQGMDTE